MTEDANAVRSRFGYFESSYARTRWLQDPAAPDRLMAVEEMFAFNDATTGRRWTAEPGFTIDGATIPRALWTLVGSPYTGDYRFASIVHDAACVAHPVEGPARRAADRMFYNACRAGECKAAQAFLLYAGVRIGSLATLGRRWKDDRRDTPARYETINEKKMIRDYKEIAGRMVRRADRDLGSSDSAEVAEDRFDAAYGAMVAREVRQRQAEIRIARGRADG